MRKLKHIGGKLVTDALTEYWVIKPAKDGENNTHTIEVKIAARSRKEAEELVRHVEIKLVGRDKVEVTIPPEVRKALCTSK